LHGCQIAIRLDHFHRSATGEILFYERRHYVTSLDPSQVSTLDLMRLIRGHWQIENCLHFVKDRWWDEDRHWTKRPGLAAVFAALTNAAISTLRMLPNPEPILRAETEKIQWNPKNALKSFGWQIK
jgi:predicted transposase YbfD/YdcC